MRLIGIDFGRRRIGLAMSDATGLLARPWRTVDGAASPQASAAALADLLASLGESDESVAEVRAAVIGLPRRLNGEETEQTTASRIFGDELGRLTGLQVYFQDERLSSREAETRLALREPDWRARKRQLDAAAAAVILQDFLDARPRPTPDDGDATA